MLEYARVCKSIPEYAIVCQSKAEYVNVCQFLGSLTHLGASRRLRAQRYISSRPILGHILTFFDSPCQPSQIFWSKIARSLKSALVLLPQILGPFGPPKKCVNFDRIGTYLGPFQGQVPNLGPHYKHWIFAHFCRAKIVFRPNVKSILGPIQGDFVCLVRRGHKNEFSCPFYGFQNERSTSCKWSTGGQQQ